MKQLAVVLTICVVIVKSNAAKILGVFPTPSFSHHVVYRTLTQELAKRGHDVVVITTHPAFSEGKSTTNLTEIDVFDVSHNIWQDGVNNLFMSQVSNIHKKYLKIYMNIFEKQIQSKAVQELIKNKDNHFDLLILESIVVSTLGLAHVFNAPVIQISSFGPAIETYSLFGVPNHPLLYPTAVLTRAYDLTLWESLENLYRNYVAESSLYSHADEENVMLRRNLGSDTPPTSSLYKRVTLYFQNVYPFWMNNPPVPQNVIYLGGLHQKPLKDLPQELKHFLDTSTNGAIYVSFGTNVNPALLSPEKIEMMTIVFSKLPYEVLWKREKDISIKGAKNIKILKWFPQCDVLKHPKIKLFITQGGLHSTEESIMAGVPLIGIPIVADQWFNTEHYVQHKIGLQIDWETLTEEKLSKSIAKVVEDKSYKENIVRLRNVVNDQRMPALDRAIWWTEYVLRHGNTRHLSSPAANLSWVEYFEVNLILMVLFVIICAISALVLILYSIVIYIRNCFIRKSRVKFN